MKKVELFWAVVVIVLSAIILAGLVIVFKKTSINFKDSSSSISEYVETSVEITTSKYEEIVSTEESTLDTQTETEIETEIQTEMFSTSIVESQASSAREPSFPINYEDQTSKISIFKEFYASAAVYAAHLSFSDYTRFGTFTGASTVSQASDVLGALLCVNGDYSTPCHYKRARQGIVLLDGNCYAVGLYNAWNGKLFWGDEGSATAGTQLSTLVSSHQVTDTFQFGPALVVNGVVKCDAGGARRPRTFMGTNGQSGDIWICVCNGDLNDGVSYGLTSYECAAYLLSKGCTFVFPLDGGGSSEMVFQGQIINDIARERGGLYDFVFFR